MFFVTAINAVWNDGGWSDENQNSDQSWIWFFFFFTMFSVFQMLRIKSFVEIFHVRHFNSHVTLRTVNHIGKAPFAQLLATTLSRFSFHVVARNESSVKRSRCHFSLHIAVNVNSQNIVVAGMLLQFGLMWGLNPFYKSILSKCIFVQLQFKCNLSNDDLLKDGNVLFYQRQETVFFFF